MISLVRDGQISLYCECIVENGYDNLILVEENIGPSAHMEDDNSVVGDANGD